MNVPLCLLLCAVLTFGGIQAVYKSGHCPMAGSVSKCMPKCFSDYDCSGDEKCCPNKCGGMSCASTSPVSTGRRYKGTQDTVWCAGVKCRAFEKCERDRRTKREKCVQA